jgi:O-antigen/teichoic acid export membrane protein
MANLAWPAYKRPKGSHRKRRRSAYERICTAWDESLFRNSVFLTASTILTAVCGFGATSLLTRLYPVQAVGLSAAAASAGALIEFLAQFGANYSLPRFLPGSTRRAALINTMLTLTMAAALLGVGIFFALPIADRMYAAGGWLFVIAFVLATVFDAGETNLAVVLLADRSADRIARASIVMSLVNLAAPAAFRSLGMVGAYISRVIAGTAGFFVFVVMLARRGHKFRPMLSVTATRGLRRFSAGTYLGNIFNGLPQLVLPVIILARFGSSATAYWYTAMVIASALTSVPGSVSRVLLPEASSRPAEGRALVRRSALLMIGISIPMLGVAYLVAPVILAAFGHGYVVHSLVPLRLLIIAGLASGVNYTAGSVLVIAKKARIIAIVNAAAAAVVLGTALLWARDLGEVAICWSLGVATYTVLFGIFAVGAIREVRGRWQDLGADRQPSAAGRSRPRSSTSGTSISR